MVTRTLVLAACAILLCPWCSADRDASVVIHPDRVIGKVNPLVFGNNMLAYQGRRDIYGNRGAGIWNPEGHCPVPEYVALSKLAGVTVHRWPGGCGAHRYNWKKTVGPLADRPEQQFGLPEFLAFCEATDAAPLLTLAVYWGEPSDAADIVEYLNSPADGSNPNGGEDWAAVRAADGHPEPYGVVWFEYGNESYHGEHKSAEVPEPRKFSAEEYSERYLAYRAAMKAVDPAIKLGAIVQNGLNDWNRAVLERCGPVMDFAIEHTYTPGHGGDTDDSKTHLFMQACTASDTRIQSIYDGLNGLIEETTGRQDIPFAITEYNGWFVQSEPLPYRQTLANALRNAEHLRVMMRPRNRIAMANFWQFANEYWGMARGYVNQGETPVRQANFLTFQMYAGHFGDTLVESDVACDSWDFEGGAWIPPRTGKPSEYKLFEGNLLPADYTWEDRVPEAGASQTVDGGTVEVEFSAEDTNYYAPRLELPAEPLMGYRVIGLIKTEALQSVTGCGFQVGDARGWTVTRSCTTGGDVRGTNDWTPVTVEYQTLADTSRIEILARRLGGKGSVSGKAWYRLQSVEKFQPANAGAVPDLGVNCSTRADGTVTAMIVNKNIDEPVPVSLSVDGHGASADTARAWLLSGPEPWATNLEKPDNVTIRQVPVDVRAGVYYLVMPPCSMAAIEITP